MSADVYLSNGSLNWLLASSVPALLLLYLGADDIFSRIELLRHREDREFVRASLSYNSLLLIVVAVIIGLVCIVIASGYMLFPKS